MSIIFEGVDGTGKTTNIKKFMTFNNHYMYVHNWNKPNNTTDILSEATKEVLLLNTSNNILFDRSFVISEYVYANVLNRETPITLEYVRDLIKLINNRKHTIKLFYFEDISSLTIKDEDKHLPFEWLNNCYLDLFMNQVKVNKLIVENVSKRII